MAEEEEEEMGAWKPAARARVLPGRPQGRGRERERGKGKQIPRPTLTSVTNYRWFAIYINHLYSNAKMKNIVF